MKVLTIIILSSFWSMFGMEPVQPDDISVYDQPAGYESSYRSESSVTVDVESKQYEDKGWVSGDDELHVNGYPTNADGYSNNPTYDGRYGNKGWVYDCDELHVTGLPSDPETGYTRPGYYGNID